MKDEKYAGKSVLFNQMKSQTRKVVDAALPTVTDIKRSDKRLEIRLQRGGVKP